MPMNQAQMDAWARQNNIDPQTGLALNAPNGVNANGQALPGGGGAPGSAQNQQAQYYQMLTQQMQDRAAGRPVNGMVGSPNLGSANALLQWAHQMDAMYGNNYGTNYLMSIGQYPNVTQMGVSGPGTNTGGGQMDYNNPWAGATRLPDGSYRLADGSLSAGAPGAPGYTGSGAGGGVFIGGANRGQMVGGAGGVGGVNVNAQRQQSPFELQLQNSISGLLGNTNQYAATGNGPVGSQPISQPNQGGTQGHTLQMTPQGLVPTLTGYHVGQNNNGNNVLQNNSQPTQSQYGASTIEDRMRTRAGDTIAAQQRNSMDSTRANAVQRGAANGATGDAGIQDQLNRVSAQGASQQINTGLDIDKQIADMNRANTIAGQSAGNQLLGTQLGDTRSLVQLIALLNQQATSQRLGGLSSAMGGL